MQNNKIYIHYLWPLHLAIVTFNVLFAWAAVLPKYENSSEFKGKVKRLTIFAVVAGLLVSYIRITEVIFVVNVFWHLPTTSIKDSMLTLLIFSIIVISLILIY